MHPRSDHNAAALPCPFYLSVSSALPCVFGYRDHLANNVHHFDIPGAAPAARDRGGIAGGSAAFQSEIPSFPCRPTRGPISTSLCTKGDYWEFLLPFRVSPPPTPLLDQLAKNLDVTRRDDPLHADARAQRAASTNHFDYVPRSTKVDSPIDVALDFAARVYARTSRTFMITLVRSKLRTSRAAT